MSSTTFKVNPEYFTVAMTNAFLKDLEAACQTMDIKVFTHLFVKYDLTFMDDYQNTYDLIKLIMTSWINPGQGSVLLDVTSFDSKCIYCVMGKSVKAYKWTYQHKMAAPPMNRMLYESKMALYVDIQNNRLTEFGVCNSFLSEKEMTVLNEY